MGKNDVIEFVDFMEQTGVPNYFIDLLLTDGFRSIEDFNGLTAERLMAQYPGLKFGTAHRLCLAATKLQEASGVRVIKNGELYGHMLAGQEVPKASNQFVEFNPAKHGDQLVNRMLNYYGTKTALFNMARDFGFEPDTRPDATVRVVAEDIVNGCFEDGRLKDLFRQLNIDFNGDLEMAEFLSQFQRSEPTHHCEVCR